MKITKELLKQIIKEEISATMKEGSIPLGDVAYKNEAFYKQLIGIKHRLDTISRMLPKAADKNTMKAVEAGLMKATPHIAAALKAIDPTGQKGVPGPLAALGAVREATAMMGKDAWEDAYREAAEATVDLQKIAPPVANDVAQPILLAIRQARMKLEEAGELYMKYTGKTN